MSLTLDEARTRADLIGDVSYDLDLDLTDRQHFTCTATVRFSCRTPGAETFLELARAEEVTLDGVPAPYEGGRIRLADLSAHNEVVVRARVPYVTDGDGMHTFTDPADGETYVSAYVGMDVAQRVFPCFDQNDLKATISLSVTAPSGWTVLANGVAVAEEGGRWRFTPTPPLPVAMFVVCAGPWHSVRWEHAGLPFAWHARRSLAAALDRDAAELREVTQACFDHYTSLFTEPYPFDSYEQAMVPGQNWGALETPGCVTYRDELLPADLPSAGERRRRTTIIAHEMAHMWFGNLVTMTWWEDTWLQESFADHMGYRVAEAAAGVADSWADFLVLRAPGAYQADQCRSTHPVAAFAEEVGDVDTAAGNFDAISYAKGNACLQQLVTWLGDEEFLAGVNVYLTAHRFSNATLADFVAALDQGSDRDVRGWVEAWLRTTGFDTIRVRRDEGGPMLVREGTRPHRIRVDRYDDDLTPLSAELVDLGGRAGQSGDGALPVLEAALVLPNAGGETFARVRVDEASWAVLARRLSSLPDPVSRAVVWSSAFDQVGAGDLDPDAFVDLAVAHLPAERAVAVVDAVLAWTRAALVPRYLPERAVPGVLARVARACRAALSDLGPRGAWPGTTEHDLAVSFTRGLATSTDDVGLLRRWLAGDASGDGPVAVDAALRWRAAHRLATLGAVEAEELEELRRRDGTATGDLGAARALAARPTKEAKEAAWHTMFGDPEVSNRMLTWVAEGFWDPEHADLVRPWVPRYVEAAPEVAQTRGQAFGRLVGHAFPAISLSGAELSAFDDRIARGVPTVLRRSWEDSLDVRRARAGV